MIQEFVERWYENKDKIEGRLTDQVPKSYVDLVTLVIEELFKDTKYGVPDFTRITEIEHGGHHGTLLYVIAAKRYEPEKYWLIKMQYGTCSACDALESVRDKIDYGSTDKDEILKELMSLALHVFQNLKEI